MISPWCRSMELLINELVDALGAELWLYGWKPP